MVKSDDSMTNSGPGFAKYAGYTVTADAIAHEVVIELDGVLVCRTRNAVWVQETKHKPALYVPQADVKADLLSASDTSTYCPFKGTASYHSVQRGAGEPAADVFWYYPEPYDEVLFVRDYFGVYQDRVSAITINGTGL